MLKTLIAICFAAHVFALDVPLTVKECAGVGVAGYPIQTVIPIKRGLFQNTNQFRITDPSGATIQAQFDVLSRRWMDDKSITNILATYQVTVSPFSAAGTGTAVYHFKDDGTGNTSHTGLQVTESGNLITVVTGPLKFIVRKTGFNIIDGAWFDKDQDGIFASSEKVVNAEVHGGGHLIARLNGDTTFQKHGPVQYDADRTDLSVVVEKSGPIEAVIRVEAVTKYLSPSDHTHGWAVRIFAYSGKSFIKVDYQLQNSSKLKRYGYPLYFHGVDLAFSLNLGSTVMVKTGLGNGVDTRPLGKGLNLMQIRDSACRLRDLASGDTLARGGRADGFMDFDDGNIGVSIHTRHFWKMWPNGIRMDSLNRLSVELFPEWSCQINAQSREPVFNSTHLYWLQDMQHVYKEVVLNFHSAGESDGNLTALEKTIETHPVASMPVAYVASAASSLDLEGCLPLTQKRSTLDSRLPSALSFDKLGWDYYSLNDNRPRKGTSQVGGAPTGGGEFWATENPSDWFALERDLIGEMNIRPQWMAQYNHERDFALLRLGTNEQAGGSFISPSFEPGTWRVQYMGNSPSDSALLGPTAGNGQLLSMAQALDDTHCWLYRSQDAMWTIGNPWARDWYLFMGEFRKNFLASHQTDLSDRANAHRWAPALSAYKLSGDTALLRMMVSTLVNTVKKEKRQQYGDRQSTCCGVFGEQAYMVGYWVRQMVNIMDEIKSVDPVSWGEIFNLIAGWMDWNYQYANYGNTWAPAVAASYLSGQDLVDVTSWFVWNTGHSRYKDHMEQFIRYGINGGTRDQGITHQQETLDTYNWNGEFNYRWVQWVFRNRKQDSLPPAPVKDLKLKRTGNQCLLQWTAPEGAGRYHVIWGDRPLVQVPTDNVKYLNWWAANVVACSKNSAGRSEQALFSVPDTGVSRVFAAVFSWDSAGNLSGISNIGMEDTTLPTASSGLTASGVSASGLDIRWNASSDPESGIWYYTVYLDGIRIGQTEELTFPIRNLKELTRYQVEVAAVSGSNAEGLRSSIVVTTLEDAEAPIVVASHSVSKVSEITLIFSEPLDSMSAVDVSHYQIREGGSVKSIKLDTTRKVAVLRTDTLSPDSAYTLVLSGIKDASRAGNLIVPGTGIRVVHRLPLSLSCILPTNYVWDVCAIRKASVFVDLNLPLEQVPDAYLGLPMLRTGTMQDKSFALKDVLIKIVTNKALKVFIVLDDKQTARPKWLTDKFSDNGDNFTIKGDAGSFTASVWEGSFASDTVILGGLGGNTAYANYFVVVCPQDSSWIRPPVESEDAEMNDLTERLVAFPNPFNPQIRISLQCRMGGLLRNESVPMAVLYDLCGRQVARLAPVSVGGSGRFQRLDYLWNAASCASGRYVVSIKANGQIWKKSVVLLK